MGCLGSMTCTITSTIYHQFNCMSRHIEYILLHFDYVGVGATIYTLTTLLTWTFFHAHEILRDNLVSAMLVLYFCNGLVQLLPCYAADKFLLHKNVLFLACAFSILMIGISWAVYYSNSEELRLFWF